MRPDHNNVDVDMLIEHGFLPDPESEEREDYLRALQQNEPPTDHRTPPENQVPNQEPEAPSSKSAVELEDRLLAHELRTQRVRQRARDILVAERRGPLPPFDAGTLRDMLARPRPPRARVDGLILWEASTLIPAQRKTGKTTLLLNLGRSLLTGEPFLGKFEVRPLDGIVAFLNYEVSGDTIARWADEAGLDQNRFFIVNLRSRRNPLADPEDRATLAALLRSRGTEAILTDPFGRAYTGANHNDNGEVGAWLADLDRWTRGEVGGRDLVLTTHAGWNQERTRGPSALEDWADSIVTMTRDREGGDNGPRYLRAIGRDVDVEEDRLNYDPETRLLSLSGSGSRKTAANKAHNEALEKAVLVVITDNPGITSGDIGTHVRAAGVGFQSGDERQAAQRLVERGLARVEIGKRSAKHHFAVDPSRPLPTTTGGSTGTPPDPFLYGRGPYGSSQGSTPPEAKCSACGGRMTVTEPGQTTHPNCQPGAAT
jgi:hypothetical protein